MKLDSWEGFRAHLLGNSKRGQGVSAVTLATLCHIIMRLSGSRKPSLKEYKAYRFAGVLRRHTRQAGWSIRKTAGEIVRELGSGADQAGPVLGSPGGWAPTEL